MEPGSEFVLQSRPFTCEPEETILSDFAGVLPTAQNPVSCGKHQPCVAFHKLVESLSVATFTPSPQQRRIVGTHRRLPCRSNSRPLFYAYNAAARRSVRKGIDLRILT